MSMRGRIVTSLALMAATSAATAQTSELYLNDWSNPVCYVVQNGVVIRQFNRTSFSDGPGLVVQDTIKHIGQDGGTSGREYDLNGNLLSGSYLNPAFTSCYDGATDGDRNWTIAHNDFNTNFAVLVADADWGGLAVAFVPANRSSGITYDAVNNSLWITNNVGGSDRVQQFDTSGNLISEFPINLQNGGGYAIAWDPADDTLWVPGAFGTGGNLYQYDKSGNLLQTVSPPGLGTQILGAEFQAGGPTTPHCIYQVSKVKNKANNCGLDCDVCPYVRGDLVCTTECGSPNDCAARLRGFNACRNGAACKVSADLIGCDVPPRNCKRCR